MQGPSGKVIGIFLILVLIAIGLLQRSKKDLETQPVTVQPEAADPVASPEQAVEVNLSYVKKVETERNAQIAGMTTVHADIGQDGLSFSAHIAPSFNGCKPGDFDIIEGDLRQLKSPAQLYLSLENLVTQKVLTEMPLTLDQLKQESSFELQVPKSPAAIFGLFLCSKLNANDRCAQMQAYDMSTLAEKLDLIESFPHDKSFRQEYPQGVKPYYLQSFAVASEQIFLKDSGKNLQTHYKLMMQFLESVNGLNSEIRWAVNAVQGLQQRLGSLPSLVVGRSVMLNINRKDRKNCAPPLED